MEDYLTVLTFLTTLGLVDAQCFSGGDIAASILVPLILASLIVAAVFIALWKTRKIVFCPGRKQLKPVEGNGSAAHRAGDHAEAYSNPGFTDDTDIPGQMAMEEGHGGFLEGSDRSKNGKDKKTSSPKKGAQKGSPTSHQSSPNKKMFELPVKNLNRMVSTTSLDDTYINTNPEIVSVNLQSQDFIGLGFNIQGSMRDGIRVSQVHNRGPAIESGKIHAGDKIQSVTISFEKMVYEDALTILSYASPYPVKITLQQNGRLVPDKRSASDLDLQLNHPIYRSQSLDALTGVGKDLTFKKKRNFSEMKSSDSNRNGHPKIHTVQLSSCKEGESKNSGDLAKWRDVNMPDFQDGKFTTDEADKLFSDADRLFVVAKGNVEKKSDVDAQVNNENIKVMPGELSFSSAADKTNTSFFDVTSGDTSMLSDTTYPSDTLENISVSLNDTPVKENIQKVQEVQVETSQTARDFDALFSKLGDTKPSFDTDARDHTVNATGHVPDMEDKGASLFDVQLEMDQAESRVSKGLSEGYIDAKQSIQAEAGPKFDSFSKKKLEIEEDLIPTFQSSKLNAALDISNKQTSIEEDEIVPENRQKGFEIDSQIEFEDVERSLVEGKSELSEVAEKLTHHMLRESSSVEASVTKDLPSDEEPVVEESLEAVHFQRDSSNDQIFGASLRDTRPLFQDEVIVDDVVVVDSVTQQFSAPNFSVVRKVNSSSADEESSADEGEYKILPPADQAGIEVSHDLSAEDLKSFKDMMSDRASRVEASSGDVIQDLRRGVSNENVDISTRPITRASSYDVVSGSRDNDQVDPIQGRPGSFKSEKKGQVDSSYLEWSGKRLVRSGSFGEIPQLEDKDSEDQDWTFNNNNDEEDIDQAFEKYKSFQTQQHPDSVSEEQSSKLIKTKIYPATVNLADLSGNNSEGSSRSSSPVTANGGTHTSRETHVVSKSYTVSSENSFPESSGSLGLGKYSFSVRTGSDGEDSDSMA